jgi:hypothetical protein
VSKGRNKKGKTVKARVSAAAQAAAYAQPPAQTQSLLSTLKEHSIFVAVSLLLTFLVAVATIVPAAGYVQEKWYETLGTIDFSGDIDQKRPFSIPLLVKNPSFIFAMHVPKISCWVDVFYTDGKDSNVLMAAQQPPVAGLEIIPGGAADYSCSAPDNFAISAGATPGGPVIPIKQADMFVTLEYETWIPFSIKRNVTVKFVMFQSSTGFRWIKGDWMGTNPGVVWPPNVPKPPWYDQRPSK